MKRLLAGLVCAAVMLTAPELAFAQGNDNDYTPLNSRIRRARAFPLDVRARFDSARMTRVMRERSKDMLDQFTKCLYNRSNQEALAFLAKTDIGFQSFEQIGTDTDRAVRVFGFRDCLGRVATSNNSNLQLSFGAGVLRQWLLQEAYLRRYPDGPSWVQPGYVIGERVMPLSQNDRGARSIMEFADCVVQTDPNGADYFFRTPKGSADEGPAVNALVPSLGSCLPSGVQLQLNPPTLRVWLGEALWHAAANSAPAPAEAAQDSP